MFDVVLFLLPVYALVCGVFFAYWGAVLLFLTFVYVRSFFLHITFEKLFFSRIGVEQECEGIVE